MSDELLPYYQRELAFIRRMGAEFAATHPEVASGLRLGPDSCEDPHVERMILAFSYLAARIRHKLDDDFPEISSALLGVLYPHYLAPIPSMAIMEMQLDRGQGALAAGYRIARDRVVETDPVAGEACRFRTAYDVQLLPVDLVSARLAPVAPSGFLPQGTVAVLKLELRCYSKEMSFEKLQLSKLRFFLNGQTHHVYALYDLLFNHVLAVGVGPADRSRPPRRIDKRCIRAVGFEEEEAVLPWPASSFPGYRMLAEYFAFPAKFCFFDFAGLEDRGGLGQAVQCEFFLDRTSADLEQNIGAETFRLGCTPIVNLFRQRAEPIRLTHAASEYRVVPDARRPQATEVYSVERVTATSPGGEEVNYQPFFSLKHGVGQKGGGQDGPGQSGASQSGAGQSGPGQSGAGQSWAGRSGMGQKGSGQIGAGRAGWTAYWSASRRPSTRTETGEELDHGTEVFLSLVDPEFQPSAPLQWTIDVETSCLNRDLPKRLPFGGGQPRLHLAEGGPLSSIACLTAPTATLRPKLRRHTLWRLISHLSLNHLSIAQADASPDALREILKLYDQQDSAETRSRIEGILQVAGRHVVGRVRPEADSGFCRGVEIRIEFDEERYADNGLFLFASVLERFLGLYCTVNSFTKLVVATRQKKGVLRAWPPRSGEKTLL